VFKEYEGAWPVKDMIQQFLSNSSKHYAKDLADEQKEKSGPDRKAIEAYLADHTKAADNKSSLDSDSESESGDLEPTRTTKMSKTALPADSESEDETDEESEEVC